MDKLIIGIVVIWGALWLLGVAMRVLSDFASAVSQQWQRTRPGRERVGYAVGHPMGVLAGTMADHRLMSMGFAITLFVTAVALADADSASLVSHIDALGGKDSPLLGWAIFGGIAGIAMGVGSRVLELGWFRAAAISRVPDIGHLRAAEEAAARYFRVRSFAAAVGAVILLSALAFSYLRNSGYDPRTDINTKSAAIAAAGADGKIAVLNGALEDAAGRLQSDPTSGLKILAALQGLRREGGPSDIERVVTIAQKYLEVYREQTEKFVTDGKPEAFARSEAFSEVDRVASLKWLGRLHESGKGGNRDFSKAFSYYNEAAKAGDIAAAMMQDQLVHMMVSSKEDAERQAAFKYLEPRAQAGGPSQHYWLGEWYARSGRPEDVKNAEKWLVKALKQDAEAIVKNSAFSSLSTLKDVGMASTLALDELAPTYAKGKSETMKKEAYAYLEQRANAGDPGSAMWMGFRFSAGDGVAKDEKKAREWFLKAARQDKDPVIKERAFAALGERVQPQTPEVSGPSQATAASGAQPSPGVAPVGSPAAPLDDIPNYQKQLTKPLPSAMTDRRDDPTKKTFTIPANSSYQFTAQGWSCDYGYRQIGSACQYIEKPANSTHQFTAQGWSCDYGYKQIGSACQYIEKPANSTHQFTAQGWSCDYGYKQIGSACQYIEKPANSTHQFTAQGWSCDYGYKQIGSACQYIEKPANSTHQFTAQGWSCDYGYRQIGSECRKLQSSQ